MRTKLAAVITAAAVTLTPVSVANANAVELPSSTADIKRLSSAIDIEGLSSKLKVETCRQPLKMRPRIILDTQRYSMLLSPSACGQFLVLFMDRSLPRICQISISMTLLPSYVDNAR